MRFAETKAVEQQSVVVLHQRDADRRCTRMGHDQSATSQSSALHESIGRIGLSRLIDLIVSGKDDRIADVTHLALFNLTETASSRRRRVGPAIYVNWRLEAAPVYTCPYERPTSRDRHNPKDVLLRSALLDGIWQAELITRCRCAKPTYFCIGGKSFRLPRHSKNPFGRSSKDEFLPRTARSPGSAFSL
jgi:hypothetical protein